MSRSRQKRPRKKPTRLRRDRKKYGVGELFLALVGVAFLVLFVVLVIGAFIGS